MRLRIHNDGLFLWTFSTSPALFEASPLMLLAHTCLGWQQQTEMACREDAAEFHGCRLNQVETVEEPRLQGHDIFSLPNRIGSFFLVFYLFFRLWCFNRAAPAVDAGACWSKGRWMAASCFLLTERLMKERDIAPGYRSCRNTGRPRRDILVSTSLLTFPTWFLTIKGPVYILPTAILTYPYGHVFPPWLALKHITPRSHRQIWCNLNLFFFFKGKIKKTHFTTQQLQQWDCFYSHKAINVVYI